VHDGAGLAHAQAVGVAHPVVHQLFDQVLRARRAADHEGGEAVEGERVGRCFEYTADAPVRKHPGEPRLEVGRFQGALARGIVDGSQAIVQRDRGEIASTSSGPSEQTGS